MQIFKKLLVVLTALAIILSAFSLFLPTRPALAATPTQATDITGLSDFSFTDGANITAKTVSGDTITFSDPNVFDNAQQAPATGDYVNDPRNFPNITANPGFCDPGQNNATNNFTYISPSSLKPEVGYGINVDPAANLVATPSHGLGGGTTSIDGVLKLGYWKTVVTDSLTGKTSQTCMGVLKKITIANTDGAGGTMFQWNTDNIVNLNNTGQATFLAANDSSNNASDTVYLNPSNDACKTGWAIILSSSHGDSGTLYKIDDSSNYNPGYGDTNSNHDNVGNYTGGKLNPYRSTDQLVPGECHISGSVAINLAGAYGQAAPGYASLGSSQVPGGSTDSCVGASSSAGGSNLNWIICPVVAGISTTANAINDFVQGQLNVNVKENFGKPQIQTAWTVFKDIVSALLVIVMLVMVISQAVGGGGVFDAYTVKKMLPKLVIAIIGMQISWYVCIWLVGLFNDVGQGIGDLIAAPFGGQSALDLPSLLQNLNPAYAVIVGSPVGIGLGTLLGGIGVYLFWPTLLLGAFLALMAVIAALATLLVRNIILILAIIVAPLALIAWTLPGTQKFWKDWYGNFTKALMLFPIVMVVIIGGRIFAWIAANRGGVPGPLDLIMIFVGYLGPYFFLPKTFKYGGSLLAQASQGINKAKDSINKKPSEYFKNRQKIWNEQRSQESKRRYGNQTPFRRSRFWQYPLDKFKSGEWDPLLGRAAWMPGVNTDSPMRRKHMTAYKEQGLKEEEAEQAAADKEAILDEKRLNELGYQDDAYSYNHDHYWQDRLRGGLDHYNNTVAGSHNGADETYRQRDERLWRADHGGTLEGFEPGYRDYDGRVMPIEEHPDEFETNATLNRIAELGADTNHLEILRYLKTELASGDGERVRRAQKWMQNHKDFILKNYPHMLKGRGSTLDANEVYGVHGSGGADLLADTTWVISHNPARRRSEQFRLRKYVKTALENMRSNRRESIEQGYRRAMKALGTYDNNARNSILVRNPQTGDAGINTNRTARQYGTRVDPVTHTPVQITDRTTGLSHLAPIEITPEVLEALGPNIDPNDPVDLRAEIDRLLDTTGAYISGGGASPSPATRRSAPNPPPPASPGPAPASRPGIFDDTRGSFIPPPSPMPELREGEYYTGATHLATAPEGISDEGVGVNHGPSVLSRARAQSPQRTAVEPSPGSYEPTQSGPEPQQIERIVERNTGASSATRSTSQEATAARVIKQNVAPGTTSAIDAGALRSTIRNAMREGAEGMRDAAYEGTLQAHRRAGLLNRRGVPQTPRQSGSPLGSESTRPPEGPEGQNFDAF